MRRYPAMRIVGVIACSLLLASCLSTEPESEDAAAAEKTVSRSEIASVSDEKEPLFTDHESAEALQGPFEKPMQVTKACLNCHREAGDELVRTVHWTWQGPSPLMVGHETDVTVGKMTTINNFCISANSNWPRCTECHAGYGRSDDNFDFTDQSRIDCLVCHEQTGEYRKNPKAAGMPLEYTDLVASAQSVALPTRANCGTCHFFSGGGDNAKKGDLSTAMIDPDEGVDVHMGRLDFRCQSCHQAADHDIRGSSLHIGLTTGRVSCTDCHTGSVHNQEHLDKHTETVACQSCHIPAFSRSKATKTFWDWSKAGRKDAEGNEIIRKDAEGNPIYDSKKGEIIWTKVVRPEYAWWNGTFTRMLVGDTYDAIPANLASPIGAIEDMDSKIYPFKIMRGIQPADTVRKTLVVPHFFPSSAGPNAYWKTWDWGPAIAEGMASTGLEYSGTFDWVETYMYMAINHEVAPKSEALTCMDCHYGGIDFEALGYEGDPMEVGGRTR
jgi:octaheme c-type cytochrome (tetrathionate reductase family)